MVDAVFGPESRLPYAGDEYAYAPAPRRRPLRRRVRVAYPWASALSLLACGVGIARSTPVFARDTAVLAPVIVVADRAEWRREMRADTLARMLVAKHVDSATAESWAREFVFYGEQVNVNPKLLVAIAYAESEFNPHAYSRAGAVGLMQVIPARTWWREYERRCGMMTEERLHDPHVNICFGAYIFKEFLTRHDGDTDRALAAYNNGSGAPSQYPDRVYASLASLRR